MKHISLDTLDAPIKAFVRSLASEGQGIILELEGEPVLQTGPPIPAVDREKLRAAIIARRDESRRLNADWEHVDREVWEADLSGGT